MEALIWIGAVLSLAGMVTLFWCILKVWRARRANLEDDALRAVVQSVLPYNLGALLLSVFGLTLVALGILLS